MRCSCIEVDFKYKAPINKKDGNEVYYTEESIINACKDPNNENIPITYIDTDGNEHVIGIAKNIIYSDGYIHVNGIIYFGGSCEYDVKMTNDKITSFTFGSIGISY